MLARNFMTATELSLDEHERDALIGVLGMLERGEFGDLGRGEFGDRNIFNMNCWYGRKECGTVGCIGGWCDALYNTSFDHMNAGHPVDTLFYPGMVKDWNTITQSQAAHALRNYLATGKPDWAAVVAA